MSDDLKILNVTVKEFGPLGGNVLPNDLTVLRISVNDGGVRISGMVRESPTNVRVRLGQIARRQPQWNKGFYRRDPAAPSAHPRTALSLRVSSPRIIAVLLGPDTMGAVQFSTSRPAFSTGVDVADGIYFAPSIVTPDGNVDIDNHGAPDGTRLAFFMANPPRGNYDPVPFNIHIESVREIDTIDAEGDESTLLVKTPIIIDPDMRYPEGLSIPPGRLFDGNGNAVGDYEDEQEP